MSQRVCQFNSWSVYMSEKHSEHTVETSVNYKKVILFICMAVMLELLLCLFVFPPPKAAEPVTLNVALYGYIPDYGSFEDTVRESWEEAHPEVKLHFVQWDCYESVVPDDLDVFVFDAINLDVFADAGSLLPLSEEDIEDYDDLIPSFMNGCRIDGTIYAVPQLLCTDFLFTRKSDTGMSEIKSIDGLYHALGDSGLLTDYRSDRTKVILYLQALIYGYLSKGRGGNAVRESSPVADADQGSAGYRPRRRGRQKRPLLLRAKVLVATVPVAYVFRIKPGGDGYLQEAKKNAGLLPGFRSEQIQGDL